jgi:octaprenyl-diphosphate synthase
MNQEYIQRLEKIEAELNRWLSWENVFSGMGKNISAPEPEALFAPIKDILSRGGKRWRPLLMTLVCETLGGEGAALPLAPLVEFSHNASLIHDDIEDNSDERRGKPAVHHIYGVDTAINSGSFFYFLSTACIEAYPSGNKEYIYKLWAEYMRKLHLGQAMDISWHRDISSVPEIDEYYVMCAMKTGCLARFAAELGAYAANASAETARQLGEAAEKLGIGFQILDDVKNLTIGISGKIRGDDIVEGKKSLPVLLYLTRYPDKREMVYYCFHTAKINGAAVPEVGELIQQLTETGILKEAEEKGRALIEDARGIFSSPDYVDSSKNEKCHMLLKEFINLIS